MISPGPNILRFTRLFSKQHLIYDVLKFRAHAMNGEEIHFQFLIPIGNHGGDLIRDLKNLVKTKSWVLVDLVEQNKMLAIKMIKELPEPQEKYQIDHELGVKRVQ